jgi:hypothetical protein
VLLGRDEADVLRQDRRALRSAGSVVLLASVFVMVSSQVVYAAGDDSENGDLLAPLNITSSEGVPVNGYELNADGGSIIAFKAQALAFALSGLFTLIRLLVGLAGWAIEVAFQFPLLKILTSPAQKVSDAYNHVVVDALGIKGLLLAWAFVFAGFMIVRGRVGRGLGEIFLTLLIAAFAASAFVRPDYLLSAQGPLGQSQQVGAEVAQRSVGAYDWGGKIASKDPCASYVGMAEQACLDRITDGPASAADVARPLQEAVTNALVVKPYMLLQYGRILDPAKESDRKAYAVHLKWISGGYRIDADRDGGDENDNGVCDRIRGEAKKYCEKSFADEPERPQTPDAGLGDPVGALQQANTSDEDVEFRFFLSQMRKAGPVGEACADYAERPTWDRVGGAVLLLIAALFICGMLLSCAIVMLGTQGVCAAAAAAGGVAFVAGMLPGPARQSVWKWLSLWGIAVLALVGVCAFIPFFGIAVDAVVTDGPDLVVERLLLIDVLAVAGAAGHRRLLTSIASFGRRMAMRMRYAKVGGTHMPGDTSELGAALAMNSPNAAGYGGGLRVFAGGGRYGMLGTRQRLMGALASVVGGTGMPVDAGRILADAQAEAGRGLAPLTAAAALGGLGARLGAKGAHWLLVGKRPHPNQLAKLQKPTAEGDMPDGGPHAGGPFGSGPSDNGPDVPGLGPGRAIGGPLRPGGPPDRYRDDDGQIIDRRTGQVLHDQNSDRTLLSTRAHNRLVRFRGYRILNRTGRTAYGATLGLPANVNRARPVGSRYSHDARQQVRVWANTVREDARGWSGAARHLARALQESASQRGGTGQLSDRRLTTPAASPRVNSRVMVAASGSSSSQTSGPTSPVARAGSTPSDTSSAVQPDRPGKTPRPAGPVLPGGGSPRSTTRDEARARFQDLMRRTEPAANPLRDGAERRAEADGNERGPESMRSELDPHLLRSPERGAEHEERRRRLGEEIEFFAQDEDGGDGP